MNNKFPNTLKSHRVRRSLSTRHLAEIAKVPQSLISGLENHQRRVGENNAGRLADALELDGGDKEAFIFEAINTSSQKILEESKDYPAEVLNFAARALRKMGILPEQIFESIIIPAYKDPRRSKLVIGLNDYKRVSLEIELTIK